MEKLCRTERIACFSCVVMMGAWVTFCLSFRKLLYLAGSGSSASTNFYFLWAVSTLVILISIICSLLFSVFAILKNLYVRKIGSRKDSFFPALLCLIAAAGVLVLFLNPPFAPPYSELVRGGRDRLSRADVDEIFNWGRVYAKSAGADVERGISGPSDDLLEVVRSRDLPPAAQAIGGTWMVSPFSDGRAIIRCEVSSGTFYIQWGIDFIVYSKFSFISPDRVGGHNAVSYYDRTTDYYICFISPDIYIWQRVMRKATLL